MRKLASVLVVLGAIAVSAAPAGATTERIQEPLPNGNTLTVQFPVPNPHGTGCSGAACNGLDPYDTGCAASFHKPQEQVLDTNAGGVVVALVTLEYAGSCNAWWAEIVPVQPPATVATLDNGIAPMAVLRGYANLTDTIPSVILRGQPTNLGVSWTPMFDGNQFAAACLAYKVTQKGYGCTVTA